MAKFESGFPDDDLVSDELYLIRLRHWRNAELARTDWTQLADTVADKTLWAEYRQALRDLPTSNLDPRKIKLPIQPA